MIRISKSSKILFLTLNLLIISIIAFGQGVQFNLTTLNFNGFSAPTQGTALQFGPDSRLYITDLNGQIRIYTIIKSGNSYTVVAAEAILHVQSIPNYDDTGTIAWDGRSNRQVTGLVVTGTSQNPVIYVTSSDPKWGGPTGSGGDRVLDTNSGIITKLTWNGSSWNFIDLVRGLPRSEENHSLNGLDIVTIQGKKYLLVTSGGNTNAGSPGKNFAYAVEYALSSAVLSVDLDQIESFQERTDPNSGRKYKYDLPTLDDPSRPNLNGIYDPNHLQYNGVDVGDPFGGNDGLNMAKVVENGPVQIFSGGYRNTYDILVQQNGRVLVSDNGPNANWGGMPENEANPLTVTNRYLSGEPGNNSTNTSPSGEYVTNQDHLLLITNDLENYVFGSFYGGHPTPIRANPGIKYQTGSSFPFNPGGAGLYTRSLGDDSNWTNITPLYSPNIVFRTQILQPVGPGSPNFSFYAANSLPADWPPVPTSMAYPEEADYRAPDLFNPNGPQPKIVTIWNRNTNALAEYKSSAFNNAIKGAIIAGKNGGFLHLVTLNENGSLKTLEQEKWNLNGGNALGLTSNADNEIFPGTIWVATLNSKISILTPANVTFCPPPTDLYFDPLADYDGDGFSNQDEIQNGTDFCSGASKPNDFDNDLVSDLNDLDDDNDNLNDAVDPFQLGISTNLPINNDLFSDKTDELGRPFGYLGLGLTGLMNNGAPNPNWLNWLDVPNSGPLPNDIFGGAAGAIQVAMTGGTANGTTNTQQKGFQFGINSGSSTGEVTITAGLLGLQGPQMFYDILHNGELGIQVGDGTQSNFFKLVFTKNNVTAALEINNIPDPQPLFVPISESLRPTANENIDFILKINPLTGTINSFIQIGSRPLLNIGSKQLSGSVLFAAQNNQTPLAVGIYGSTFQNGVEFLSTWDYFKIEGNQPIITNSFETITRQVSSPPRTISLLDYFDDNKGKQNLVFSITENSNNAISATISTTNLVLNFPSTPAASTIKIRATDQDGMFIEQNLLANIIPAQRIDYRINAGGNLIGGENNAPNWQANTQIGSGNGIGYQVNGGTIITGNVYFENRHPSIPFYISENTFEEINATARQHNQNLDYSIPVSRNNYIINLYFSNPGIANSNIGSRVFDISIEGNIVRANFDIISSFGNNIGGMLTFPVSVSDGVLNIQLIKKVGDVLISGIELIDTNPSQPLVIIDSVPNQNSVVSEVLDGNLFFRASGGYGTLTYSAQNLPPGVDIEPVNGRLYGTIGNSAVAGSPYNVLLKVSDNNFPLPNEETLIFTWSIQPFESWKLLDENQSYSARHEHSFVQAGDRFYVMGGRENGLDVDVYDFKNDTWENKTGISPFRFNHFQAVENKGLIWIIGAFQNNAFPNEINATHIWTYDPVMEKYYRGPEIPVARRRGATGLVVYQDKFYLVGGNNNGHAGGFVPFFDEYDPIKGTWTILPNAPRPRDHAHATLVGNKIYMVSGRLTGGIGGVFAPLVNEIDVFDFQSRQWTTLPSSSNIPTGRAGALVANFENKIYVAGGETSTSTQALNVVEILDPSTNAWSTGPGMNFPRHGIQGIISGNGLFVTGGSPTRGGGNQKNMEYFGINNPTGSTINPSSVSGPSLIQLQRGVVFESAIAIQSGNQAIFIDSVYFQGPDASNFGILNNQFNNSFLFPNTNYPIRIIYNGTQQGIQTKLIIKSGFNNTLEIPMNVSGINLFQIGLIAYWDMEEGNGNQLIDKSGLSNNATISNVADVMWPSGPKGTSLGLPGTPNRFGSVPHNATLNLNSTLTIAAWIRPSDISTKRIITKGANGFELGIHNTNQVEFRINRLANGTTHRLLSNQLYPTNGNTWIHVAVTYDGNLASMYINGQLDKSAIFNNANILIDNANLQIGARNGIDRWLGGIDELRLYNRALNASEVNSLFSGQVQIPGAPTLISPSNFTENLNTSPSLSWSTVEFAINYHLQIATDASFNDKVFENEILTSNNRQVENLLNGGEYFWRVASSNQSGKSQWSETRTFRTIQNPNDNNLVGYWKMEENSGSTLIDYSQYGNNASISFPANVSWGVGIEGRAINMAGIKNGHGNVNHNASLVFSNALTISAWVRPNRLSNNRIISKMNGDGFELGTNSNGKLEFRINRQSSGTAYRIYSNTNYPSNGNTWIHVAVTFNGTSSSIYVNGVLDNSFTYPPFTINPNSASIQIGAREGIDRWEGALDEIRLFRRSLTGLEIAALLSTQPTLPDVPQLIFPINNAVQSPISLNLTWSQVLDATTYRVQVANNQNFSPLLIDQSGISLTNFALSGLQNSTTHHWRILSTNLQGNSSWSQVRTFTTLANTNPNLIGLWKMNEGSGNILFDNSGFNHNATIQISNGVTWVAGKENLAIRLDGINGRYALVPHNETLNVSQQITLSAWIKPTALANRQIISKGGPNGFELSTVDLGKIEFRINREANGSTFRLRSIQNYPTNGQIWIHVVATFNGTRSTLYINGVLDNSQNFPQTAILTNTSPLQIGTRNTGSNKWIGDLDDLRLYNVALTESQIQTVYNENSNLRISGSQDKFNLTNNPNQEESNKAAETSELPRSTKLYPNPVIDDIFLQLPDLNQETIQLNIFDMQGNRILDQEVELTDGILHLGIKKINLRPGSYILIVNSNGYPRIFKFLKL